MEIVEIPYHKLVCSLSFFARTSDDLKYSKREFPRQNMYHEWNIVWQYMYWYSTIVSLMMIPIIQCTQVYCTCTFNIPVLICTIVHSRNINTVIIFSSNYSYNAEHVQRFFKSWFCTERKRLILHVFLNEECELA